MNNVGENILEMAKMHSNKILVQGSMGYLHQVTKAFDTFKLVSVNKHILNKQA